MTWDQRPVWAKTAGWAESQLGEGGANAANNCVTTCVSRTMLAYGYPDLLEPQDFTDAEFPGQHHIGYTDVNAGVAVMQKRYPTPPPVSVLQPANADLVAAVDAAAARGFAVHCTFWCNRSADIGGEYAGQSIHDSIVTAHLGGNLIVSNVERGLDVTFTEAQFRAAAQGADVGVITIFQRALPPEAVMAQMTGKAVALAATPSGNGYRISDENGAIYCFGDATYLGGGNNLPSAGGAGGGGGDTHPGGHFELRDGQLVCTTDAPAGGPASAPQLAVVDTPAAPAQPSAGSTTDALTPPPSAVDARTYEVQKGDNLWSIAAEELGDGQRWSEIFRLNATEIGSNPNYIRPGQVFTLPDK